MASTKKESGEEIKQKSREAGMERLEFETLAKVKAKEELKEERKKWKEAEERYRMQEELLKKSLDIAKKTKKEIEKTIRKLLLHQFMTLNHKLPNHFL
ncbi:uncharacterized protein G2W53_007332 [Senna tora]|uniref:Uncharacterized protein n=1 Tax=Senna tora TaxID=362788 RepID=A0A834X6L1_9FABA|nr:uncharacterized protein G2W53_007332 [Senna tora]